MNSHIPNKSVCVSKTDAEDKTLKLPIAASNQKNASFEVDILLGYSSS